MGFKWLHFSVHFVFFNNQVIDDEVLAFGGVLAHVVSKKFVDRIFLAEGDLVETDLLADEAFELFGTDFSETFESGYFGILDFVQGLQTLFLGIAIADLLFVLDAEKRRLQDIDMTFLYEFGEELKEEREHEQPDVHAIHIGIGSDDDFVVSEFIESVFDVQGRLEAVEFFVLIHHGFGEAVGVERFTPEREDRLCADVAGLGDGTGCGQTLGDEDSAFLPQIVISILSGLDRFCIVVMHLTVAEFGIVEQVLLRAFASDFGNSGNGFAFFFGVLYLLEHDIRYLRMAMQVVVELGFDEIVDELVDGDVAVGRHIFGAEFDFRLRLEDGFFDIDGDSTHDTVTDVGQFLVLVEELFDGATDRFAVCRLVRSALDGILAVDEGVVFVAGLVGVGECYFDVFAGDMDDGIERFGGHSLGEQVVEAVLGDEFLAVIYEREAGVQVRVVAKHGLYILVAEGIVVEQFLVVIGRELNHRAALGFGFEAVLFDPVGDRDDAGIFDKFALMEGGAAGAVVTERLDDEIERKGINGFGADTVQTYRLVESFVIVLTAGVDDRDGVREFAQRYAASVVADGNGLVNHLHFDEFAFFHAELVDGVIDCFFDEDVDTVVGVRSVAQLTDIHTGAEADMLETGEGNDVTFVVLRGL